MSVNLATLKAKRLQLHSEAKSINSAAQVMGREVTDEELAQIQSRVTEVQSLDAQIEKIQARAGILAGLDEKPVPVASSGSVKITVGAPLVEQDPKKGFGSIIQFLGAVKAYQGYSNPADLPENMRILRATAGSDEASGSNKGSMGFLIPVGFDPTLLKVEFPEDPTSGLCREIPMTSPRVEIPARVDLTRSSSVSGGLRVYRRSETQAVAASRMDVGMVALDANSLMGITYATEELMNDSPVTVMALLKDSFGPEYASREFYEKLRGTGVGQFMGALTSPCLVTQTKETSQTAATINGTNILKMRARCYGYGNAVWIATQDAYADLANAVRGASSIGSALLTGDENGNERLLGRPLFFSDKCSALGTIGDLILLNPREYLVGTLQELETGESTHVRFVENEVAFKFTKRNAGLPWWKTALTPLNGATQSPFVVLETRS